jgi:hypothetical protein
MTGDIRGSRPFAFVLLSLSAGVSGLDAAAFGYIRGAVTDKMASRHFSSNRRASEYGYEPVEGVGNLHGEPSRQCSDDLVNPGI